MRLLAAVVGWTLLAACDHGPGGDPAVGADGGATGADAAPVDGTATVTVLDDSVPAAGALVLFHDAGGNLIGSRRTDGQGRASGGIPSGGSVSAVWPAELGDFSSVAIQTVLAVDPGDEVELDRATSYAPTPPPPVASLTIESGGAPDASHYEVRLGCTTATVPSLPAVVDVPTGCAGADGAVDVVVIAILVTGGRNRILTYETVGYAAGRVAVDGAEVGFTPPAWHEAWDTIPLATEDPVNPYVSWSVRADDRWYEAPRSDTELSVWRDLDADGAVASALLDTDDGYALAERAFEGLPASVTVGAGDFLPDPVVDVDAALRDGRVVLTLSATAAGVAAADAVYGTVSWEGAGVADGRYRWEVVAPPGQGEVELPVLPADLAAVVGPVDVDTYDLRVELLDASWLGSYAELKASRLHGGLWSTRLLDLPSGASLLRRTGNGPLFP